MQQISEAQFSEHVLLRSFEKPVAVLFSAAWCGPCKVLKPRIERLSALHGFSVSVVDAGVDRALAGFYGVRAVPSLLVFSEAKVVGTAVGAGNLSDTDFINFLNQHGFSIVVRPDLEL